MSQELFEVGGLLVALVVMTALFDRALQPLLRRLFQARTPAGASASVGLAAGVALDADALGGRRRSHGRLGSPS